jgi:hypothetical protein
MAAASQVSTETVLYLAAEGFEARVVLRVLAAHRVRHGPDEAEGRRHGLGVLSEDEAEVDVEHLSRRVDLSDDAGTFTMAMLGTVLVTVTVTVLSNHIVAVISILFLQERNTMMLSKCRSPIPRM